jgi:hypothetical protein
LAFGGFLIIAFLWAFIMFGVLRSGFKVKKKSLIGILFFFIALGVIILLMGVVIEYMESPEFCGKTCHPRADIIVHDAPMEPFYDSYKEPGNNTIMSVHEEHEVVCAGCHDNPGIVGKAEAYIGAIPEMFNYITGNYDPDDLGGHYSNEKCLKCHDGEYALEPGEVITFLNTTIDPHDDDMDCVDCHQPHQKGTGETEEACNVCHGTEIEDFVERIDAHGVTTESKEDEDCMACHNREHNREEPELGSARIPFSEVQDIINDEFCSDCHETQYDAVSDWTDTEQSLYGDCTSTCHTDHNIKETPHITVAPFEDNCDLCHSSGVEAHTLSDISFINYTYDIESEFCSDCHKTQYDAFGGWQDSQKGFYGDCTESCHVEHRDSNAPHLTTAPYEDNCNSCHLDDIEKHSLMNITYLNFPSDIENEFCSDCHNTQYVAYSEWQEPKKSFYGDCAESCHSEHKESVAPHSVIAPYENNCDSCHLDGIESHSLKNITYSQFTSDIENEFCSKCHSTEYDTLQLRNHSKRDCLDCHSDHGKVQVLDFSDCTLCHNEGQVVSGKELNDIPSSHDEDRTDCSKCHNIDPIHDI